METIKALGEIFHKLELRDKERRLGITNGLTPELDAYFKVLGQWHAIHRYPESQSGLESQAADLLKNFYIIVEISVTKYGEKGHTVYTEVGEFLRSLRVPDYLHQAAGNYIKFRENGEFRVIT